MSADDDRDVMIAVTFAEAGAWEAARAYAPRPRPRRAAAWLERHLLAAAHAEGALPADALRLLGARPRRGPGRVEDALDALLRERGVRMSFAVLSPDALGVRR